MGVTGKPVSLKISCNYGINFSCHFHHQVYNELTIACSLVGLISAMNKALHPVINRVRFPVKPEFFQVLFQPLGLFILLQRYVCNESKGDVVYNVNIKLCLYPRKIFPV